MAKKSTTSGRPLVNLMGATTNAPVTKNTTNAGSKQVDKGNQKTTGLKKK